MTPETRAAAHVALAQHSPYIDMPTIPEGQTMSDYRLSRPRKRSRWQRIVRRLNGHG